MRFNNGKGLKSINLLSNMIARSDDFNFLADSGYDTYTETLALIAKQKQLYNDGTFENFDYIVSGLELEVITGQLILKAGAAVSFKGYYHGTLAFGYVASPGDVFSVVVPESAILTIDDNIGGAYDRFDVIEIRPIKQTYDTKSRQFRDPITGVVTSALVNIKNEFGYEIQIKKGNAAVQNFAQAATAGWIKLAEYKMPVGASTVSNINITSVKDSHLWLTAKDSVKYLENKNPINLNNNLVGLWSGNVPEYPDNPAGTTYLQRFDAGIDSWTDTRADLVNVNGALRATIKAGESIVSSLRTLPIIAGQTVKIRARSSKTGLRPNAIGVASGDGLGRYVKQSDADDTSWNIYSATVLSNSSAVSVYSTTGNSPGDWLEWDIIYVGDGTYSSQALDLSGNGNHAQIFGATPIEGGFSFDGINDYLDLGDTFKFDRTQAFSIYLPIRTGTLPSDSVTRYIAGNLQAAPGAKGWRIVSFNTALQVILADNHTVNELVINSSVVSDTDYDLVITYDGSSLASGLKLYRNNVVLNAVGGPLTGDTKSPFNTLIGRSPGGITASAPFRFRYSPRIYNRAMTAAEIKELYLNPTGNIVDYSVKANTAIPNSNAVRTNGGQLKAADPIENNDLVTKSYYENNLTPVVVQAKKLVDTGKNQVLNRVKSYVSKLTVSKWYSKLSAADNEWYSVCWSPELRLFCAVGITGIPTRIMTSPDGVNWTLRTSPANNSWYSVCWSPELGLFCAVASSGTGNRVMTSPNGINWTTRTSAADNEWYSVCWSPELGLFCAVANTGTGDRVMTSPNGINWTIQASAADNGWRSVCWSPELGLFCAVANTGTGDRVMTSPDGVNWTLRNSAADNDWNSVCWSPELGIFCAVAGSGVGTRVMTSPDGINWTTRASAANNDWRSVCWSPELGLFCAVSINGLGNQVMTSPDGINWTIRTDAANTQWRSVCWSPEVGIFCAVSSTGVGIRVMTTYPYYMIV